jgi:hypothetical protein
MAGAKMQVDAEEGAINGPSVTGNSLDVCGEI